MSPSNQRSGRMGVWLWGHMPGLYFVTACCLLALDVAVAQPAQGWAQGAATAVFTVLFAAGALADKRDQDRDTRHAAAPATIGGWLWGHMPLFVLVAVVVLLAVVVLPDPARNWTISLVILGLSVLLATGMWATHRQHVEPRNS